jgi:hypothetical protein
VTKLNIGRDISLGLFFSVPSYEYYYNRPLPLFHTLFPTHSSLLFYDLTLFGLPYIQRRKPQINKTDYEVVAVL